MEGKQEPKDGPHFVGKKAELIEAERSFRTVEGRDVLIIYRDGTFHALDSWCYHSGGPLHLGDIEELGGQLCIICPRHRYKITLASGEGLYKGNPGQKPIKWLSKGVKQRIHKVTEGNGDVYVTLLETGQFDSDYYQGEEGKVKREKAAEAEKDKSPKVSKGSP
ncbi:Rieske domain-containing protein [Genypterus blacodes]|uniref:Rieske domain-containing protein n=1 Tax=Genypterus blacodes TaxID=154954 RepID=UPI003F773DE7